MNARETLDAAAHWLGWHNENLSFGLKSAADGLRLYEWWQTNQDELRLPEMCDDCDDDGRSMAPFRVSALGYDPLQEMTTRQARAVLRKLAA